MRLRVAEALHLLSTDLDTGRRMVDAHVAPTLVALCSSNTEAIRRECVYTLFNLSRVRGCERALVEAGASKALMVVALLRSHQSETQRLSMQAVHNLMADESVRMQVRSVGLSVLLSVVVRCSHGCRRCRCCHGVRSWGWLFRLLGRRWPTSLRLLRCGANASLQRLPTHLTAPFLPFLRSPRCWTKAASLASSSSPAPITRSRSECVR